MKDFEKQRSKSVLIKHKKLEHPNEDIKISMKTTRPFKDALSRQSNEVIRIENRKLEELLNGKSEMNHPKMARIGIGV